MAASRCFCCGKAMSPTGSRACAVMLFLICWLVLFLTRLFFLVAEACLLAASVRNAYHTKYRTDPPTCQTLRKGVFAAGAAFTLFTAIVSQFYYVSYSKARDGSQQHYGRETGVGMGTYK
ncbi:hypothetical protein LINPERHAP1_LOCUS18518 [Linum perenne]